MKMLIKIVGVFCAVVFLIGLFVETFFPKPPPAPSSGEAWTPPSNQQANIDPRFNGPGHPMYGKNYNLQRAGYPQEQIRLACIAMEATKCGYCNGYGRRGHLQCEACKGDGVLEN